MLRVSTSLRFFATIAVVSCGLLSATAAAADSSSSSSSSIPSTSSSSSSIPSTSSSSSVTAGVGTITIDQKNGSGSDTIGKWTLIKPDAAQQTGTNATQTLNSIPTGSYTIIFNPPSGATATTRIYRNGELESLVERPQQSFALYAGDTIKIVEHYTFTEIGLVAVESDPPGLDFRMTGPNNIVLHGTTPESYQSMPAGQYQVQWTAIQGCNIPPAKGLRLSANNRISFSLTLSCPMADTLRARIAANQSSTQNNHVAITTPGGSSLVLRDVPTDAWYASYVANVSHFGIISGYTDAAGNPTGDFGPGDNVTLAQLAKIAHKAAGMTVDQFQKTGPQNPTAQNQWSAPYIASAESRGWRVFADATVDVNRPATRAEVVVTLLQAFDIPLRWQKGNMFSDVTVKTPYANAIETAAGDGVIQGYKDQNGQPTHQFGPFDSINRAEMAKVISTMLDTYRNRGSSSASSTGL
ncbi:MAG TPA: S-layer homology domain-containing protein [Candidatus Peribacteraceae bacterium]|nr:S-layer homology domain-containing protein [Candidatus Peribacteraceae bacterium]